MFRSASFSDDEFDDEISSRSGSSSTYSLDMLMFPWKGEVDVVPTSFGPLHITVCGNRSKPALFTYHDIGLNHMTCFQGLFACSESSSALIHNFCIYHIDAPGHETDAKPISFDQPELSTDDLADQVAEAIAFYGLKSVICMGVSAGAYILTLLALNHPTLVEGLILISPICQSASWSEWAHTTVLNNILGFYGMSRFVKESLLRRYFCQEQRGFYGPASDAVRAFRRELDDREACNVMRYIQAMNTRRNLTNELSGLHCRTLILVGENSPLFEESLIMKSKLDPKLASWMEVEACGSLVTEERPHVMQTPLEYFFISLGYQRPPSYSYPTKSASNSPTSPIDLYELLSPQGLGLKLKPIKTRVDLR